jgi:molybdopterin-binding protein
VLRRFVESRLFAAAGAALATVLVGLAFALLVTLSIGDQSARELVITAGTIAVAILGSIAVDRILYSE